MEKISIVTVTYNCCNDIQKTIESVLSQSYSNIEYIIIDGASNDGTKEIIEKFSDYLSYFVSEPDNGIYDAMNKGIDVATGDWILFFNAGEVFASSYSLRDLFTIDHSNADVIFGDTICLINNERVLLEAKLPFYYNKHKLCGMGFSHQATFVKTEIAKQIHFDLSFKCCADYNMMSLLYQQNRPFLHIPVPIDVFREDYGFSSRNRFSQLKEEARICGVIFLNFKFLWRLLSIVKTNICRTFFTA